MSDGNRISLAEARALAEEVVTLLRGAAVRIEIAGSIRCGKETIGDIEIVLQAGKADADPLDVLIANLRESGVITPVLRTDGKNEAWGERHKRGYYKGMRLDLFIVRPDRAWGVTYLIRTGPGDANAYLVTRRNPDGSGYGGCPPHLLFHEGNIYRLAYPVQGEIKKLPPGAWRLDLREEADVYAALGMPFVEPAERTIEAYEKLRGTAIAPLDVPTAPITVYTGRINCGDPDALEITVGAIEAGRATEYGVILAPTRDMVSGHKSGALTDAQYTARYIDLLRWRYKWYPQLFMDVLASERVVLTCYCAAGNFCHRHLAVEALAKIALSLNIPFMWGGELEAPPEQELAPPSQALMLPDMPTALERQPITTDETSAHAYAKYDAALWARLYPGTSEAAWYGYFKSGCKAALRPVLIGAKMTLPPKRNPSTRKYPDDGILVYQENGVIVAEEVHYGVKTVRCTPIEEISPSRTVPIVHRSAPDVPAADIDAQTISLWNPWGWLVVCGLKQFETRHKSTNYRGWLVIHAAKKWDDENKPFAFADPIRSMLRRSGCSDPNMLPFGAALGMVKLVNVLRVEDVRGQISSTERAVGNYADGRYAWQLVEPRLFPSPIPLRGQQWLWKWDNSLFSLRDFLAGAS